MMNHPPENRSPAASSQPAAIPAPGQSAILSRLALIALLSVAGSLWAQETPIRRGQTPAEVRQHLGPPVRVSRQILLRRHLEQWAYDTPPLRVELNALPGEEPSVCAVLQLPAGRP